VISPPPPPPPRGSSVRASARCPLGGSARVLPGATATSVRVAVTLDNWINGYLVTLGVDGEALQVSRVAHATQRQQGPLLDATRSFSFALGEEPVEMSAFAVIFESRRWGGLVAMSCSAVALPPPPPPPVVVTRSTDNAHYYDDAEGGGSPADASSYGDAPASRPAQKAGAAQHTEETPPPTGGGGVGLSAAGGFLLVLVTLGGVIALVLQRGDQLKGLLEQFTKTRAASVKKPRKNPARKEFGRAKDGETESMVAANLDDEEEAMDEPRSVPARAAACDEPPCALPRVETPLTLDDDDDLREEKDGATLILGRPEC